MSETRVYIFLFIVITQERRVGIRAVDSHVARSAVLEAWIRHVVRRRLCVDADVLASKRPGAIVALETYGEYHRTRQYLRVHRPVRTVAGFAALPPHAPRLEYQRTA